jgi:EmrB/QacA subfamily drug resistance transporter
MNRVAAARRKGLDWASVMERTKQKTVLAVAATAEFLTTFMATSVIVAIPAIDKQWGLSTVTQSWLTLGLILAVAALLMPVGKLADVFGRKRMFVSGMAAFAVIAIASAFAPSASVLVTFRLLLGVSTAMLYACTMALAALAYPPEKRGRALGVMVAGTYLGLTTGPVLGGVITGVLGWRWVFAVTGILAAVNSLVSWWGMRGIEWREPKEGHFDVVGSLAWAVALTTLLIGLSMLPGVLGLVLIAVGIVGIAAFVWWETRASDPILNLDLFRKSRVFTFSNVAIFINYAAVFAVTFVLSTYLQYNRGLKEEQAGLILIAAPIVQTLFSPAAGRLADRVQARLLAASGMAACVVGLGSLAFLGQDTAYWYIVLMLGVLGLGFAFFSSPIMHSVMGSVDLRYSSVASATIATMRMTGQNVSMGIATVVLAVLVGRKTIEVADYPNLLTSVRLIFAILAGLCVLGVAASLVGPRKGEGLADGVPPPVEGTPR